MLLAAKPAMTGSMPTLAITLTCASALLYGASRVAVFALTRSDGSDAGRRAVAQWLPVAGTVIAAVVKGYADIAVALIFGTSVAFLSLVLGMITSFAPLQSLPASRRVWPFVLPAALLALMAGFSGHFSWWHALMFLVLGGAFLLVWLDSPEHESADSEPRFPLGPAMIVMVLALALTALGAYLAVRGTIRASELRSQTQYLLSPGTLSAALLSPLLVLPTLGTATAVAQRGYPGRALTALVGSVLLNLCLLLPVSIILWYGMHGGWSWETFRSFRARGESTFAMPYDMAAWRIETVILIVLGFSLVPVSMGRWTVGRLESTLLVVGYAGYILAVVAYGLPLSLFGS